jgi:translation initiation factor IF-3
MKTDEALQLAREQNLDLVEVAPEARPPVVRILNFKKYQFAKKQEQRQSKKKTKTAETKEFRFGPSIGPNDLKIRIDRAREFLREGDKVKITVQFKGREQSHPEIGFAKVNEVIKALADICTIVNGPERKGRFIYTTLEPK